MKYVYVKDNKAFKVIPEFDDIFPGIAIKQRYDAKFLADCVPVEDDVVVEQGYIYDAATGTFTEPELVVEEEEEDSVDNGESAQTE